MHLLRARIPELDYWNIDKPEGCYYGAHRMPDVSRLVIHRLIFAIPVALIISSQFKTLYSFHRNFALHTLAGLVGTFLVLLQFALDYDYDPDYGNCMEIYGSRLMEMWFITGELFLGYIILQVLQASGVLLVAHSPGRPEPNLACAFSRLFPGFRAPGHRVACVGSTH